MGGPGGEGGVGQVGPQFHLDLREVERPHRAEDLEPIARGDRAAAPPPAGARHRVAGEHEYDNGPKSRGGCGVTPQGRPLFLGVSKLSTPPPAATRPRRFGSACSESHRGAARPFLWGAQKSRTPDDSGSPARDRAPRQVLSRVSPGVKAPARAPTPAEIRRHRIGVWLGPAPGRRGRGAPFLPHD